MRILVVEDDPVLGMHLARGLRDEGHTVDLVGDGPTALAHLLPRCRALVTAHGGATSHGATLAREWSIPAVLGARGAGEIAEGAELFVDGAAGRVYLL